MPNFSTHFVGIVTHAFDFPRLLRIAARVEFVSGVETVHGVPLRFAVLALGFRD